MGGQKKGLGWEAGKMAERSREEELELLGRKHYSDVSFGGPGALHPDAYLISSYSANVPMIW